MKTSFLTILAFHMRDLREEKGITQAVIAEKLGMTSAGWGKVENGKSSLSVENLMKFCKLVDSDAQKLLTLSQKTAKDLIQEGWAVSYSQVENDGLIEARGFSVLANSKVDSALQKAIKEGVDKSIASNVKSNIFKYASIYASISSILPIKFKS
ncbi:helix-turn-helix domain-containing protein [Pectobacterium punjabense]|uniref:helix-turn-helix domain-containing protein n=1 Tax=Pectobacterium punjabense TaxID=2108399 RepID=UPI001969502C|nr:helix-turn-helix transcriptional regulator [Pectobacterium punjabense]MBN3135831.1 helix-turn-helix domain-containing protein [Pectobacterium punjabense]MCE5382311.1 helix-turn-helix domain-containing protein [Pectobacterium punjabense]